MLPLTTAGFLQYSVNDTGAITPDELSRALVNGDWSGKPPSLVPFIPPELTPSSAAFDRDTVKMLMGLFDVRQPLIGRLKLDFDLHHIVVLDRSLGNDWLP